MFYKRYKFKFFGRFPFGFVFCGPCWESFIDKTKYLQMLEEYKKELQNELREIEKEIERIKKEVQ